MSDNISITKEEYQAIKKRCDELAALDEGRPGWVVRHCEDNLNPTKAYFKEIFGEDEEKIARCISVLESFGANCECKIISKVIPMLPDIKKMATLKD